MNMDAIDFETNYVLLGDRSKIFVDIKEKVKDENKFLLFEIEKMNISIDDVRRMIHFATQGSELKKVVLLSSFYWNDQSQNALLKILEEPPTNTVIFLFGLSEKTFLPTILSRVQKLNFNNSNRHLDLAKEILHLHPNERLENKNVKKILSQKVVDFDYEKNTENEKKDREQHILFLYALIDVLKKEYPLDINSKSFYEKILKITELAEIDGGSPHLFIEWLLLSAPQI